MKTKVKVVKYQNPFKRIMIDGADYTSRYNNKQASNVTTWGSKYVITPNQYWKIKSVYTYQPGKKLQKVTVKNHSFTIKKNYNATITMQNTRTKVCEEINVKNPGF